MIQPALWSLAAGLVYVVAILFYKYQSASLLEVSSESFSERFRTRYATLFLGAFLILIAGATFAPGSATIAPLIAVKWGLTPSHPFSPWALEKFFVASFLHWDIVHLLANVLVIPFLLPYERKVGGGRFLLVFVLCALLVSIVEDLLPLGPSLSLGASGGLCGLITAYNIDRSGMDRREWLTRLSLSFLLIGFVSLQGVLREHKENHTVDWIAHLLAVPIAALVCWVIPRKSQTN